MKQEHSMTNAIASSNISSCSFLLNITFWSGTGLSLFGPSFLNKCQDTGQSILWSDFTST